MRRALGLLAVASMFRALAYALNIALGMTWPILWALVLGRRGGCEKSSTRQSGMEMRTRVARFSAWPCERRARGRFGT